MGYDLYIGEAVIHDYDGETQLHVKVEPLKLEEAPRFENDFSFADKSNHRHPSYSGWYEFAKFTNLYDFFFDDEKGIMREHPGAYRLANEHLAKVREVVQIFKREYPNASPRFAAPTPADKEIGTLIESEDVPIEDAHFARLLWLEWWMDWAIKNCKVPTFYNR